MGAMAACFPALGCLCATASWQGLQCPPRGSNSCPGTEVMQVAACMKIQMNEEDIGMRSPASFVTTRSDAIESDRDAGGCPW